MGQHFTEFLAEAENQANHNFIDESGFDFYEHFGFRSSLDEQSRRVARTPQVWGDPNATAAKDKEAEVEAIWHKAQAMALAARKAFNRGLRKASQQARNPKILIGIKSLDAFKDKVLNRGKSASAITDVLRSAILTSTEDGATATVKRIKKEMTVVEYEYKEAGGDKEFGYFGSHHFLVKIGDIIAEIQVMTKRLWSFKEEAHKIYNKYRSIGQTDKALEVIDKKLSKRLFKAGNNQNSHNAKRRAGR